MESITETSNGDRTIRSRVHSRSKPPESLCCLQEGISRILSRWKGLQMAVQNQWGGRDSLQKSQRLAADLFSWFSHQTAPLCADDVENLLHESLLLSLNTEIEDGSIEEVAEELITIHEDYLQKLDTFINPVSSGLRYT